MEFVAFPKISRLSRDIVITEKIDGTNAAVTVSDDGTEIQAQSRTKIITPTDDNAGFAKWVQANKEELLKLGPGTHFGEWWGKGIQSGYGLAEKRFSLFNVWRWSDWHPDCCHVVPTLYQGPFDMFEITAALSRLQQYGSVAAPGFMKPEGVIIFHTASQHLYKKTLEKDEEWKGKSLVA